jgi:hypothetical protein
MVKELIAKPYSMAYDVILAYFTHKRINKILKGKQLPDVKPSIEKEYKEFWKSLGITPSSRFLKCMIGISGIESPYYVPEYINFRIIEPTLNYTLFGVPYNDKNFFERYLPEYRDMFPRVYLRGANGFFYNGEYVGLTLAEAQNVLTNLDPEREYILKPATQTGAGKNVTLLTVKKDKILLDGRVVSVRALLESLRKGYYHNFVLQERLSQSDWFGHVCSEATNILRIYTYRSVNTNETHILHSYFRRAGKNEKFQHYLKHGGWRQGINPEGLLDDFAIDYFGNKVSATEHADYYKDSKVPHYEKMVEIVKEISSKYIYHRLLGFDIIVDANERIRLLEVNTREVGMLHHQMISGPFYGEHTHEVIDYCRRNRKSPFIYLYYK